MENKLQVRDLTISFRTSNGKVQAVRGINFDLATGETLASVGESGSGKSVTSKAILGILAGNSIIEGGEIIYDGQDLLKISEDEFHKIRGDKIAMIFQDPISSLDPRMTIKEIIGEGLIINKAVKNEKELYERVLKMIKLVGLSEDHLSRYPHEFSGGQRQRIGIARVLATNPGLIIADEPISALDVSIQAQVLNLLNELKRELGLTILFIAHNLSVVKYFCDYIGVMNKGRLVEKGTPEEIYANPVHPYTKALLSAIPVPDPGYEKWRGCETYDPGIHDYSVQQPSMHLVSGTHYVLLSDEEMERYAGK